VLSINITTFVVIVCVYRPPGTVTSAFIDQLSDLFDRLFALNSRFLVTGDFNAPADVNGLDTHTADAFIRHALRSNRSSEREVESVDNIDSKSTFGSGADSAEYGEHRSNCRYAVVTNTDFD